MLAFEVSLLTGRYVATAFNDRDAAEWPPHPARLFSALVATHFEALDPPADERAALQWLETQGAPELTAPEGSARDVVTVFVPVNDTTVVGSLDDEHAAVAEARAELDTAKAKGGKAAAAAEKKLAKARAALNGATQRAIGPVAAGKGTKEGPREAESLLPERRKRQPRSFPSVTPAETGEGPHVVFAWPQAEPSAALRATLDALASRVVRLGHSSSFVSVRVSEARPAPTWVPDNTSWAPAGEAQTLRVVEAGQLAALCRAFDPDKDSPGRVLPATFQRYVRPHVAQAAPPPGTVFGDDWTVLRRVEGPPSRRSPRLPSVRAVDVASTVRKALLLAHKASAPELLSGHSSTGGAAQRPHLAIVPLPFVGDEHANGSILGVALVFPKDTPIAERLAVHRALETWEREAAQGGDERPWVPVHMGRAGELWLERLGEEALRSTLRAETWCGASRRWASATPIALDRNPGELSSKDAKKEAAAYAEAEATVAKSCERIGLPPPARVTVVPAAPLSGSDKARQFPAFATGKPPVQRVLVHATLAFEEPVRGPILLGAGRYFGLGLFRPLRDHE